MSARLAPLVLLGMLLAGCGSGPPTFGSAQEAYTRGVEAFEAGKYGQAIEFLRTTLDFGRTSEIADDAQFMLAQAYAGDRQYLLAGTEFTRFIEFYRADPRIEQAAFERIQAYVALSPRFELDQTDTRQALTYITLFLQQYPEGEYAVAASALADGAPREAGAEAVRGRAALRAPRALRRRRRLLPQGPRRVPDERLRRQRAPRRAPGAGGVRGRERPRAPAGAVPRGDPDLRPARLALPPERHARRGAGPLRRGIRRVDRGRRRAVGRAAVGRRPARTGAGRGTTGGVGPRRGGPPRPSRDALP